jgi:ATP-dependent phosphofructokinase / diphosphate-dependent phosphofructokinase
VKEKIVLVTAGGHISSFHAGMKKMHEVLEEKAPGRFELVGAKGGLKGLIDGTFIPIRYEDLDENRAGSMIGSDRNLAQTHEIARSVLDNDVYAIVMMGGDNHLGEAEKCHDAGIRIVGYPKTMDGDLTSHITLGWETAVTVGAMQTRYHYNSATTAGRVFYVGLFGRNTDWILAAVNAYGGGDIGIPCEQKYKIEYILERVEAAFNRNKERYGVGFAVVPYSEGAIIDGVSPPPDAHRSTDKHDQVKLQPEWLGMELVRLTRGRGMDAAFQAHTYDMRDSPPTPTDKALSAMAGGACMDMILDGDFGKSAIFVPDGNGFYTTKRGRLDVVSKQRFLKPTGHFNYGDMLTNPSFAKEYGPLFQTSLGGVPKKDDLVYKNMARR